jgi:hypothetical protein
MADKHPYTSTKGYLIQVIDHFRKTFPLTVTADTLRKLGFAPKNESYILNILRFLGLIDQEGNRTELATQVFSLHDDSAFSQEFEKLVRNAYSDLFELHGDNVWGLDKSALISFFRSSDETSDAVGKLQAMTFQILADFSGRGKMPEQKPTKKKRAKPKTPPVEVRSSRPDQADLKKRADSFGLTVRIEINLPADGDQETYDRIFRSIRENLLDV